MSRLYRFVSLTLFSLFILITSACRLFSADTPVPTVDQAAIVQDVVATLEAQTALPVGLPSGEVTVTQQLPAGQTAIPQAQGSDTQSPTNPTPEIISPAVPLPAIENDLQDALITLYQRVNPAVVHIFVSDEQGFLGTGSGFAYDATGYIVTNNHVVTDGNEYEVVFSDGTRQSAELIGSDVDSDLAVIKVPSLPAGVQPVILGDSNTVVVGQFVVAIGNPFGEANSMSVGVVSALGRTLESQRIPEGGGRYSLPQVIQTDAAINPGNSGGPLLNLQGEVIGVNSAILTRTGTSSGVGFSIPVNAVKRIVPSLIANGEYLYPFIGVSMLELDLASQTSLQLSQATGAYITNVQPGTPAEQAGLIGSGATELNQPLPGGDLIIRVNGQAIDNPDDLISYLVFDAVVGQTIELTVLRNGSEINVPLTLGARP